jgi:K+-transporting ATPase ATPase B chain
VMFVVEVGSVLTTLLVIRDIVSGRTRATCCFTVQVTLWLWFTVLFANFAEAMAEGRGESPGRCASKSQDRDHG